MVKFRLVLRISGVWLLVVSWWASWLLDPFQGHTEPVQLALPYVLAGAIGFIILSSIEKVTLSKILFRIGLVVLSCLIALLIASIFLRVIRGYPCFGASFIAHQVSFILNLFHQNTGVQEGILFFNEDKVMLDFIKSGVYLLVGFYLVCGALIFSSTATFKNKLYCLCLSTIIHYGYGLLRLIWVALTHNQEVYAGSIPFNLTYWCWTLLTFVPLIPIWFLILTKFKMEEVKLIELQKIELNRRNLSVGLLFLLVAIFISIGYPFYGITKFKDSVILVDEIHSRWESTLIDFDKEIQGVFAENSYHSFIDWLSRYYPCSVVTDQDLKVPLDRVKTIHARKLSKGLLKKDVILILKCVTEEFKDEEIKTVVEFVKKGGSVFLIGDHTDVYFMNSNLNKLATHFGMKFEQNSVYMIDGGWIVTDKNDYIRHPLTQALDKFIWATGDSLNLIYPAYPVVFSPVASFADYGNYFKDYFFGNGMLDAYDIYGSYAVIGAAEIGKGRVVAFTDSTCFNNYLMFTAGRRELLQGVMQWLSSRGSFDPFPLLALLLLALTILFALKYQLPAGTIRCILIIALLIGLPAGYLIGNWLNGIFYPAPKPIYPLPKEVLVDAYHKPTHCLSYGNSDEFMGQNSYDNFLFALGRIDIPWRINYKERLDLQVLKNHPLVVIVSPTKRFSKEELTNIMTWVGKGGNLLLIEGVNPKTTINQIAHLFGMNFRKDPFPYLNLSASHLTTPTYVDGGKPLFTFLEIPVVSYSRYGQGMVLCLGDDNAFTKNSALANSNYFLELVHGITTILYNGDEEALKRINWVRLGTVPYAGEYSERQK